jgi:hypothetical protein
MQDLAGSIAFLYNDIKNSSKTEGWPASSKILVVSTTVPDCGPLRLRLRPETEIGVER